MVALAQAIVAVSLAGAVALVALTPAAPAERWRRAVVALLLSMVLTAVGALLSLAVVALGRSLGSEIVALVVVDGAILAVAAWAFTRGPRGLAAHLPRAPVGTSPSARERTARVVGAIALAFGVVITVL